MSLEIHKSIPFAIQGTAAACVLPFHGRAARQLADQELVWHTKSMAHESRDVLPDLTRILNT